MKFLSDSADGYFDRECRVHSNIGKNYLDFDQCMNFKGKFISKLIKLIWISGPVPKILKANLNADQ